MKEVPDIFGKLCREYFDTGELVKTKIEYDNGDVTEDLPISYYVDVKEILEMEKKFLEFSKGKVLDLGCGTGRIGLILKVKGMEVIGIDNSDNMIYVSGKRGLDVYKMDVNKKLPEGLFNTVIMFGNGFELPGSIENIKNLLRLHKITFNDAIIIAESSDPNRIEDDEDRRYQERNKKLGRYIGQLVYRTLSGNLVGHWENWVDIEPKLLKEIAEEAGWKISNGPEYDKNKGYEFYFFTLSKR